MHWYRFIWLLNGASAGCKVLGVTFCLFGGVEDTERRSHGGLRYWFLLWVLASLWRIQVPVAWKRLARLCIGWSFAASPSPPRFKAALQGWDSPA